MADELPVSELEVPSDPHAVNVNALIDFLFTLPQLGREFTRKAAEDHDETPAKTTLPRILSYLKYLGLIVENRIRTQDNGETTTIQKYSLTESGKELFYLIEGGRTDEFEEAWRRHLKETPAFQVVYQNKLKEHPSLPLIELQDMVYEAKGRSVSADFARSGARFLALLFEDAGLVEYDSSEDKIYLIDEATSRKSEESPHHQEKRASPPDELASPDQQTGRDGSSPQSSGRGPRLNVEKGQDVERYSSSEILIEIVPSSANIDKARKFLDLVSPETQDEDAAP